MYLISDWYIQVSQRIGTKVRWWRIHLIDADILLFLPVKRRSRRIGRAPGVYLLLSGFFHRNGRQF